MELFKQLFNMVLIGTIGYWYWKVNRPQAYPFKVSIYNFVYAVGGILSIFLFAAETSKFVLAAFACYFAFTGTVHLITNDYEKYKKDAETFLDSHAVSYRRDRCFAIDNGLPKYKANVASTYFRFCCRIHWRLVRPVESFSAWERKFVVFAFFVIYYSNQFGWSYHERRTPFTANLLPW